MCQLLIRAAAVGERIPIYTNNAPQRWASLAQPYIAVVERRRPPEFVPTIIVSDRPSPPSAGLASAVITIGRPAPDAPNPGSAFRADIQLDRADHHRDVYHRRGDRGVPSGTGVDWVNGSMVPLARGLTATHLPTSVAQTRLRPTRESHASPRKPDRFIEGRRLALEGLS